MCPTPLYLMTLVEAFKERDHDSKLAFIQTPQNFYSLHTPTDWLDQENCLFRDLILPAMSAIDVCPYVRRDCFSCLLSRLLPMPNTE